MNGEATILKEVLTIEQVLRRIACVNSVINKADNVIVGGLARTPMAHRRLAFRFAENKNAQDKGMLRILAAASVIPKRRFAEHHGRRLALSWRYKRDCASGRTSRYHKVASVFAARLAPPPSGLIKAVDMWPRQRWEMDFGRRIDMIDGDDRTRGEGVMSRRAMWV